MAKELNKKLAEKEKVLDKALVQTDVEEVKYAELAEVQLHTINKTLFRGHVGMSRSRRRNTALLMMCIDVSDASGSGRAVAGEGISPIHMCLSGCLRLLELQTD